MRHRGPDSFGYLEHNGTGLGHARLSIIDLSGGQQPIENEDGSLAVIHNGEFYNFRELRKSLEARGHTFRTRSDSEVILHLFEDYGPDCVRHVAGMFTFALYDKKSGDLFIARDRLGVKPLYYVELPGKFLFASEFKAILQCPEVSTTLNHQAVHDYLALRYVPGPGGMLEQLRKFPAGHYGIVRDGKLTLTRYWEPELYSGPFSGSLEDYVDGFAERFERSIQRRLVSEVPIGAYLSGGLDSSAIVASMSRLVHEPLRTFTVGFDYERDELAQAAETAGLLGCRHTPITCSAADFELLPKIAWHLDEPLGDPIVVPMYLLAQEARKSVTVVLSGEGADEILGGYAFHKALLWGDHMAEMVPRWMRQSVLPRLLSPIPAGVLNLAFDYPAALGERGKQKVLDYIPLTGADQLPKAYRHLISLFDDRDTHALYSDEFRHAVNGHLRENPESWTPREGAPFLNQAIHMQFDHWLPDDILTKQDKMSMAHGIEARVPFLDHELVEYVLRVPPALKIRGRQSKFLLRQYASRILPQAVTSRRKMPFYFPLERHFKHSSVQALLEDTLSAETVKRRGLFRLEAVGELRRSLESGEFVYLKQAFSLIMLELWFRAMVDRRGAA